MFCRSNKHLTLLSRLSLSGLLLPELLLSGLLILSSANVYAEVILEGKEDRLELAKNPSNQEFAITEDMGRVSGNNLFHSFNTFNIAAGETANFSGSSNIQNIISRVSGGSPSSIDGTLKSSINGANLWLLNPNGVLFGETASLDITGSLYVSTANYLQFENGETLNSGLFATTDTFSSASPSSFGFSSNDPAAIVINGSTLSVNDDNQLSLAAGPINIYSSTLMASSGAVNVIAVAEATLIPVVSQDRQDIEIGLADINISDSTIQVTGAINQGISIIGGKLVISDSSISEQSNSAQQTSTIQIKGENTVLSNTTVTAYQQSQISITSDQLTIRDTNNAGIIEASLNINNLNVVIDKFSENSFSTRINTINSDATMIVSINGEVKNNTQVDTQTNTQTNTNTTVVDNIANNEATTNNAASGIGDSADNKPINNTDSLKITNTSNELEFDFTQSEKQRANNNESLKKTCVYNINHTSLSTRPILFQPMPGEFNPGNLYQHVDLAQLNQTSLQSLTLGIFNKCS